MKIPDTCENASAAGLIMSEVGCGAVDPVNTDPPMLGSSNGDARAATGSATINAAASRAVIEDRRRSTASNYQSFAGGASAPELTASKGRSYHPRTPPQMVFIQ